uniref:Uncharacterized protein n=1 Tax=Setaria viridis TaxID=4556 RepID=A0A4U6UV28_SETVI|nr:hypothetical protein SEVIR_5G436501v2 [Setaria viridis]
MAARMEQMVQQRIEVERQRMEEENRMRMDQMFQYMQNFASSMGQSLSRHRCCSLHLSHPQLFL